LIQQLSVQTKKPELKFDPNNLPHDLEYLAAVREAKKRAYLKKKL